MLMPTLLCPACQRTVVVPFCRFEDSDLVQPYWPEEPRTLHWICDRCSLCTAFERDEIRWKPDSDDVRRRPDEGFWRVCILCSCTGCPCPIVAYVRTFGMTSRRYLGRSVAGAHPTPLCELRHRPAADSRPRELDFVDWNGGPEYLV